MRESQVRCVGLVRNTHYGPESRWQAVVSWADWPNGEGGDLTVQLGPHSSGALRITWAEASAVLDMLRHLVDDEGELKDQRETLRARLRAMLDELEP